MKTNKEMYPKTGDAIEAYKGYCYGMSLLIGGHVDPFEDWLEKDVEAYSLKNRESERKPKKDADDPLLAGGMVGLAALIAPLLAKGNGKVECGADMANGSSTHVKIEVTTERK